MMKVFNYFCVISSNCLARFNRYSIFLATRSLRNNIAYFSVKALSYIFLKIKGGKFLMHAEVSIDYSVVIKVLNILFRLL